MKENWNRSLIRKEGCKRPADLKKRADHLIEQLKDIYGTEAFEQTAVRWQAQEYLQSE